MRIVLVSPSPAERSALEGLLSDDGHEVAAAATRAEGVDLVAALAPELLLADARVAGLDGVALIRMLSERGLHTRVLLLCPRAGACPGVDCLTKPIDLGALRHYISKLQVPRSRVA